jgi:hypothetical protein
MEKFIRNKQKTILPKTGKSTFYKGTARRWIMWIKRCISEKQRKMSGF